MAMALADLVRYRQVPWGDLGKIRKVLGESCPIPGGMLWRLPWQTLWDVDKFLGETLGKFATKFPEDPGQILGSRSGDCLDIPSWISAISGKFLEEVHKVLGLSSGECWGHAPSTALGTGGNCGKQWGEGGTWANPWGVPGIWVSPWGKPWGHCLGRPCVISTSALGNPWGNWRSS